MAEKTRKSQLKIVGKPAASGLQPPRPLGQAGRSLWEWIIRDYELTDAGGMELLTLACECLDRAEALRAQIDSDGEIQYVKNVPKAHPAIRDEINCRKFIAASLSRLGLALEVPAQRPVGRPVIGGYGITETDWAVELGEQEE
jgi:hypothetical protein